jgi:PucR C-terminal helix-turn-helix domain
VSVRGHLGALDLVPAGQAAAALCCRSNTVRHRLRRPEESTGRSLAGSRGVAELVRNREAPVSAVT